MNIAIVEHNKPYRESLKTALNQIDGFNVAFDDDNIASLLNFIGEPNFQIILLDWTCLDTEGVRTILQLYPSAKILILSNHIESSFPNMQVDGVSFDFIAKSSAKTVFEQKIIKSLKIVNQSK